MNFLSHFYFDRHTVNCYHILGTVLPDLLKNADKTLVIHPEKLQHPNESVQHIIDGWKKHLEVDRHFHSSHFFALHSHQLRLELLPALTGSPVKPFFLGHIAIELILDNLLLTSGKVMSDDFYVHLSSCDDDRIREFLKFSGMPDPEVFIRFYAEFKRSRYLNTYAQTDQVAYALKRICMRVWANPFTPGQEAAMTHVIEDYRQKLRYTFMEIFEEIEGKLL